MVACVVDGRRRLARQKDRDVLVFVRERVTVDLVSDIEIPEYSTTAEYRNAEKRSHRRVTWRKPVRFRMFGQIRQANRLGLSDDEAEDAVTTWRRTDTSRQLGVDSIGREMLERLPIGRENTDGGVARADDFCRHLHRPLKHTVEGDFGDERRRGGHEALQAVLCRRGLHDG